MTGAHGILNAPVRLWGGGASVAGITRRSYYAGLSTCQYGHDPNANALIRSPRLSMLSGGGKTLCVIGTPRRPPVSLPSSVFPVLQTGKLLSKWQAGMSLSPADQEINSTLLFHSPSHRRDRTHAFIASHPVPPMAHLSPTRSSSRPDQIDQERCCPDRESSPHN